MADLPHELINEILLWLPVKSLLRFRCVSKTFCATIGSQSFINSHFKTSSENNIHRKLIDLGKHRTDDNHLKIHAVAFSDDFQQELVLEKLQPREEVFPLFFSYCNGLVLMCLLPWELFVWNPSTRQCRILPAFPKKYTPRRSFALGYDSVAGDYKVVAIISKEGWDISQVWIFELMSSCWRRIQDFPYFDYNNFEIGCNGDCFVDGALHFICYRRNDLDPSYIIVAFDVAKETFSVIYEPGHQTGLLPSRLHVYRGCLSMSLYSWRERDQVDMYVRKKDEDAFTWTRIYSVRRQQFSEHKAFDCFLDGRVAYLNEGNKVVLSFNGKLCSYDLEEKSLQEIVTMTTDKLDIFSCTESLMSVGLFLFVGISKYHSKSSSRFVG